jgi:hypothetical protein
MQEPMPVVSFHCACGERVYTVSTNVAALKAVFLCVCGTRYECKDSLIAERRESDVSPTPEDCHSSHSLV